MQESRSRSAGHRRRSHRSHRVPYAPLAGLAVLLVLGLVFGLAYLRQPSTTDDTTLNLASKPVPQLRITSEGEASPTPTSTDPATAAPKKHKPKTKKSLTTTSAATRRPAPKSTTHKPRPRRTTTAAPTTSTGGGGGSSSPGGSVASQVLTLTNAERAKVGCKALKSSAALTTAAQAHSADMAAKNYFSHDSQDGRSPFDRMKDAGYNFSAAAENIAMGQPTPAAVMDAWMNSAGHKANILNCTYTQIGIGYATGNGSPYWTQDFGTPL